MQSLQVVEEYSKKDAFSKFLRPVESARQPLRHKVRVGVYSIKSPDHPLEDKVSIVQLEKDLLLVSLFDGHDGVECAEWLSQHFPRIVDEERRQEAQREVSENALRRAYSNAEKELLGGNFESGACGVSVVVDLDDAQGDVHVMSGNVGDCWCVVTEGSWQEPKTLTVEHRADGEEERARVVEAGGWVSDGRVFGLLSPSRTFGDCDMKKGLVPEQPEHSSSHHYNNKRRSRRSRKKAGINPPAAASRQRSNSSAKKQQSSTTSSTSPSSSDEPVSAGAVVVCEPHVASTKINVSKCNAVMVMGSDGLFDVVSAEECASIAKKFVAKEADCVEYIARTLCLLAQERKSRDDITCVVVCIGPKDKQ